MSSTTFIRHSTPRYSASLAVRVRQVLRDATATYRRFVTRRELEQLTAFQLRDIGLDPTKVSREPLYRPEPRTLINLMSMR